MVGKARLGLGYVYWGDEGFMKTSPEYGEGQCFPKLSICRHNNGNLCFFCSIGGFGTTHRISLSDSSIFGCVFLCYMLRAATITPSNKLKNKLRYELQFEMG